VSAAGILAGELGDARKRLKRCWSGLTVARLEPASTDYVSGCLDRAIDHATEAIHALEGAEAAMRWYNALTEAERAHWHRIAGSAVPADAWRAFKMGESAP
jgi:hypothetical protein